MRKIEIKPLSTMAEMVATERLQHTIWGSSDLEVIPAHSFHALVRNGACLYGAFDGPKLVGFVFGVLGTIDSYDRIDQVAAARLKLYSVVAGVLEEYKSQGIGYQLKLAQREFAQRIGIRLITWTYDPLESLNGRFNIGKLGAICHRYFRDFHGDMSGINAGLPSDRFEAEWWITSSRVEGRVVKQRGSLGLDALLAGGAILLNSCSTDGNGCPVPPEGKILPPSNNLVIVEIPSDFQAVKRQDFQLASRWREHSRQLFEALFQASFMATDFVLDTDGGGKQRSFYLLTHKDS